MTQDTFYRRLARTLSRVAVRRFPRRFGLFEMAALGSAEWLRRHLAIINELETLRVVNGSQTLSVIDFGGADGSLQRALRLYGIESHYRITVADIESPRTGASGTGPTGEFLLLQPDGRLPVEDRAYDVAVSSDVFEHIPALWRSHWAAELHRVARLGQVHSVPADDIEGRWRSTVTDREFAGWYRARFGEDERWTAEHLTTGAPSIEELQELFPGAVITGIVNCGVWLHSMEAKYGRKRPPDRLGFAIGYLIRHRANENTPPFKNALIALRSA